MANNCRRCCETLVRAPRTFFCYISYPLGNIDTTAGFFMRMILCRPIPVMDVIK